MSTDYYRFRAPITSVRGEVRGGHTHVGIWINHAKAGDIIVRNEEWQPFLEAIRCDESACEEEQELSAECPDCRGSGQNPNAPVGQCKSCGGRGEVAIGRCPNCQAALRELVKLPPSPPYPHPEIHPDDR